MAFVKLDSGFLDSSLWSDRDARDVFLTALLMATPIELTESLPQLSVWNSDVGDFFVPPGWYGIVHASGLALITRSCVPLQGGDGLACLYRLGEPDPHSRSAAFDGRRLVRVDGGFIVLNWSRYRERDMTAAERSRRWRARHKKPSDV